MARFSMHCPLCEYDFTVGAEDFGQVSLCPNCLQRLRIPDLHEMERQADFRHQQEREHRRRHSGHRIRSRILRWISNLQAPISPTPEGREEPDLEH